MGKTVSIPGRVNKLSYMLDGDVTQISLIMLKGVGKMKGHQK